MAIIDIILLICFIPGIVSGLTKGFVRDVIETIAILIGAWTAFHFSSSFSTWISESINMDPKLLQILSFVLIVVIITLLLKVLGSLITKLLKAITLGWLNSLLGLVFGIIKVGLILGILIMIFESLNSQFDLLKNGALDNAVVYNKIKDISQQIFPYFKSFISGLNV